MFVLLAEVAPPCMTGHLPVEPEFCWSMSISFAGVIECGDSLGALVAAWLALVDA
jgi:hypothetical protein